MNIDERIGIEEYLQTSGELTYRNVGVSMLPMLKQGRDLFTVSSYHGQQLKKYDVVLFKRKNGDYVLHRIVGIANDGTYTIMGDNCLIKEPNIKKEDIMGVLISFDHKGKTISVDNRLYMIYSRVWYLISPCRILIKKVRMIFDRTIKHYGKENNIGDSSL